MFYKKKVQPYNNLLYILTGNLVSSNAGTQYSVHVSTVVVCRFSFEQL